MAMDFYRILSDFAREKTIDYIQIGAMDGVRYDPMWPFLQKFPEAIGKADVFEPHPIHFQRLSQNLANFPQIKCHNLAIGSPDCNPEQTLYYVHPIDIAMQGLPQWVEGISSFHLNKNALGGIGPHQTPEMHNLIKPYIRNRLVRAMPLKSAFDKFGIQGCDVLLTDTEGHDWEIVKQWDFQAFGNPTVIYSEVICLLESEKKEFLSWLEQNGYDFEIQGQNVIAKLS